MNKIFMPMSKIFMHILGIASVATVLFIIAVTVNTKWIGESDDRKVDYPNNQGNETEPEIFSTYNRIDSISDNTRDSDLVRSASKNRLTSRRIIRKEFDESLFDVSYTDDPTDYPSDDRDNGPDNDYDNDRVNNRDDNYKNVADSIE